VVAASAEEIRRDLCYELKWMLRAVVRFEELASGGPREPVGPALDSDLVALQDSALLHARNLVEFAKASSDPSEPAVQWALSDILGTHRRKVPTGLTSFLDCWVVQPGARRASDSKWPKDHGGERIGEHDDARLSRVVEIVFKMLKPKHRTTTLETDEGIAYVELLDRAHEYFEQRSPEAFGRMTCDGNPMPAPPDEGGH